MLQTMDLANKQVLIIGMGISGRSAARFLMAQRASVKGVDRNFQLLTSHPEIQVLKQRGLIVEQEERCQNLCSFDLIVLSPGIPQSHFLVQAALKAKVPLIGEIELGCQFAKNPIWGITGTNGKTTVTLLVTHVLKQCGHHAHALGNVGIPFTQELLNIPSKDALILELSSYQIETLYQPCLETGLLLNITPDHLDRYGTMEAYANAKCQIERCLKPGGHLYINEKTWQQYGYLLKEKSLYLYGYEKTSFIYTDLQVVYHGGEKAFDVPPLLKNKKSHHLENLLAAYALCSDKGITGDAFIEAWNLFKIPDHRIQLIADYQGVRYYDDSKGTNIDAVIRAVQSLDGAIILIAGGVDKGAAYTPWLEKFKNKVKLICAIGQAADKIKEQLSAHIPVITFNSLEEAVQKAAKLAERGESVLLSPGCSSFDMFKDYAHRGKEFQRIVHNLEKFQKNT